MFLKNDAEIVETQMNKLRIHPTLNAPAYVRMCGSAKWNLMTNRFTRSPSILTQLPSRKSITTEYPLTLLTASIYDGYTETLATAWIPKFAGV